MVSERTRAVAVVSLAQVLGFVVGPALQAAAAPLGGGGPYAPPGTSEKLLRLDMYTAAGWINALLGLVNFALFLPCCFKERRVAAREAMLAHGKQSGQFIIKFFSSVFNELLFYLVTYLLTTFD